MLAFLKGYFVYQIQALLIMFLKEHFCNAFGKYVVNSKQKDIFIGKNKCSFSRRIVKAFLIFQKTHFSMNYTHYIPLHGRNTCERLDQTFDRLHGCQEKPYIRITVTQFQTFLFKHKFLTALKYQFSQKRQNKKCPSFKMAFL